jgi:ketosteroid isomerase-like protein
MISDATTTATESATTRQTDDPHDQASVRDVANRFVQTYGLTHVDPDFAQLFANTIEYWHSFDHETLTLSGDEFAGVLVRMLRATAEIVRRHSDRIWSLEIGDRGFAMAATASGELDGVPMQMSRCLLVTVHDGRITRICEFSDLQQRAPLDEVLRAAGRFRS